ncbi:MFS transporter [Salinarimonas ramus]|uniref:MFS transporter n=1 Tax=Salinarimonas ramus TaxID=690164 RepID=A0A917Q4M1_9HYPH|nr:MFS transporter [Salinarimonas ramus]GGK22991.1 MFS transporter [Salinarimonas ramus]
MRDRAIVPAGIAIVGATYGLARYTYGLFVPEIGADFALDAFALGLVASGSYAAYLIATLFGSTVSATLGPRLPVVLGGVAAAGGMAAIALAPNVWVLAAGVVLAGASPGLAYPPMSDAVMRLVPERGQNRAYAWINSGTSFGVLVSGPVAILAGTEWRTAWLVFAGVALAATLWNAWLLPGRATTAGEVREPAPRLTRAFLARAEARPLFAGALAFGLVTSVFWTFAVELVVAQGGLAPDAGRTFWILIGIAGVLGGLAGDLVRRFGLSGVLAAGTATIALATGVLALAPGNAPLVLAAGALYGAAFILVTGLYGIWSVNVFNDRPSAGFGATFFLISAGQLVGPALAGAMAQAMGLGRVFLVCALLALALSALRPAHDVRAMSRDANPQGEAPCGG